MKSAWRCIATAGLGADFWEQQGTERGLTLDSLLDRSEVVDVGIDGGGLDDLLGLAVVGRDKKAREWLVWTHAWAHPSVLERRKSEASRFQDFSRDGDLTLVQNIGDDVYEVAEIVAKCESSGLLDKVGCDPDWAASWMRWSRPTCRKRRSSAFRRAGR